MGVLRDPHAALRVHLDARRLLEVVVVPLADPALAGLAERLHAAAFRVETEHLVERLARADPDRAVVPDAAAEDLRLDAR